MGPIRKINNLVAQAQSLLNKTNWTIDDLYAAMKLGLQSIVDGVGVGVFLEKNALTRIGQQLFKGEEGTLPGKLLLDFDYSVYPQERCAFHGGPYDSGDEEKHRIMTLTEGQRKKKIIVLKDTDKDDDTLPDVYVWTGWAFEYQGPLEVEKAA